jgi:cysteine desulfurase
MARATANVLDAAREAVASMCGVSPRDIVFVGGGTEACNVAMRSGGAITGIVVSPIEHSAISLAAQRESQRRGVGLATMPVTSSGVVDVERAIDAIPDGSLVALMAANNETGAIQPVAELRTALHERGRRATLVSDAIGAAAVMDLGEVIAAADIVTIAGHKLGGPPSVAVMVVREGTVIDPLVVGGGQELSRRGGTPDVAGIVGFATALRLAQADIASGAVLALAKRRNRLQASIVEALGDAVVSAQDTTRLASHLHLRFPGLRSDELLVVLDEHGICASAGSACSSGASTISHVLEAMGIPAVEAKGALRLSLSTATTDAQIDEIARQTIAAVLQLRG